MLVENSEIEIESGIRRKYSGETGVYKPETISHLPDANSEDFSQSVLRFKFELVRKMTADATVLDVGCGNGLHALEIAGVARNVRGIDYSAPFIAYAQKTAAERGVSNAEFRCENARALPYADDTFDVAYCFAALYCMPAPLDVISEIARVLKPGGRCVLEFGNVHSLNSIVCRYYPELAESCHISVKEMKRVVSQAELVLQAHYSFQLLPMWADRPRWMRPLLHPALKRLMSKRVAGRMLDEWCCRLPILRNLAFRHILVCEKKRTPGEGAA